MLRLLLSLLLGVAGLHPNAQRANPYRAFRGGDPVDTVPNQVPGFGYPQVKVTGATGDHAKLNGKYTAKAAHGAHQQYANMDQFSNHSIIYFDGGKWKVNVQDDTKAFVYSIDSKEANPPSGEWVEELTKEDKEKKKEPRKITVSSVVPDTFRDELDDQANPEFGRADADGNGCITPQEASLSLAYQLRQRFKELHPWWAMKLANATGGEVVEAKEAFATADKDGNGCIDKSEFGSLAFHSRKEWLQRCLRQFVVMDTNHDAKVSMNEAWNYVIQDMPHADMQHLETDRVFRSADADSDGFVSEQEFCEAGPRLRADGWLPDKGESKAATPSSPDVQVVTAAPFRRQRPCACPSTAACPGSMKRVWLPNPDWDGTEICVCEKVIPVCISKADAKLATYCTCETGGRNCKCPR